MTTIRTTPTPPRTVQIQVSKKGKLRLVDADLLGRPGEEPYQKHHHLSEGRTFDDGKALLDELQGLVYERRNAGQKIDPEELLPFVEDIRAVLVRGGTMVAHGLGVASMKLQWTREWLGSKPKCW